MKVAIPMKRLAPTILILCTLGPLALACKTTEPGAEGSTGTSTTDPASTAESAEPVDTVEPTDTGDVALAGACPLATRVGGFELTA